MAYTDMGIHFVLQRMSLEARRCSTDTAQHQQARSFMGALASVLAAGAGLCPSCSLGAIENDKCPDGFHAGAREQMHKAREHERALMELRRTKNRKP